MIFVKILMVMLLILAGLRWSSALEIEEEDWLIDPRKFKTIYLEENNRLRLTNGLIQRDFTFEPNFGTIDFYSVEDDSSLLRAFSPEAQIIVGTENQNYSITVGGFNASISRSYLNRTNLELLNYSGIVFKYQSHQISNITSDIKYSPRRGAPSSVVYPPLGIHLNVSLVLASNDINIPSVIHDIIVHVHYQIYDNVPLVSKWLTVANTGSEDIKITVTKVDELQVNLDWSPAALGQGGRDWLQVTTDTPHGAKVDWKVESFQAPGAKQPMVQISYDPPPVLTLKHGEMLRSIEVFHLVTPYDCLDRRGLARRKMMRILTPWILENPIFFHMTNNSRDAVRNVMKQMVDVGFEMMIHSFGSGFDMMSTDTEYLDIIKENVDFAKSLGLEVGGYNLIAWTRKVKDEWTAINEQTNGSSPSACLASGWYDNLVEKTVNFLDYTGLSMVETDGPYGGYTCSSEVHTHHQGLGDSVYQQNRLQSQFFKLLRSKQVYINQPDTYYLQVYLSLLLNCFNLFLIFLGRKQRRYGVC